jgi:hypothetical protein
VEDQGAGHEQVGIGAGIHGGVQRPLREGHVIGRRHESPELSDGHLMTVDPEAVHLDAVHGALFGIEGI